MELNLADLDHLILALSTVKHRRDYHPEASKPHKVFGKDHLQLLDDVAILLVTRSKSDVAAVTIRQTATRLDFYWSKNAPSGGELQAYIDEILGFIRADKPPNQMLWRIIGAVIQKCEEKISHRLLKCQKSIEEFRRLGIRPRLLGEDGSPAERLLSESRFFEPDKTDEQNLRSFFDDVVNFDIKATPSIASYEKILTLTGQAYVIGNTKILSSDSQLERRVRKLGAYFGAPFRIIRNLKRPEILRIRDQIYLHEVMPPPPKQRQLTSDILEIINTHARNNNADEISYHGLIEYFPRVKLPQNPKDTFKVTITNHCELTVALKALSFAKDFMELGVSKGCCWLCQRYLQELASHAGIKINVGQYQGKIHSGWSLPSDGPPEVAAAIVRVVESEAAEIRESVLRRRKSDSFPATEGSLEEALDPVNEMFDMRDVGGIFY